MSRIITLDHQDTALDVLGRISAVIPKSVFESYFEYDQESQVWDTFTSGSGSFTYSNTSRTCSMSTGGSSSGARSLRQTKIYIRFRRGKTSQVNLVTNFNPSAATFSGAAKNRVGYYDDSDGVYFQYSASGFAIVSRASGSGSVVENVVPQSQWSLDKLDGTGPSRIALDPTKGQSTIIEFNSFRTGRIRFGFRVEDHIVYCHEINSLNLPVINFKRRSLPLRFESINDGGSGANVTLNQGGSFANELGSSDEEATFLSAASNSITPISLTTTLVPLLSARLKSTFASQDAHALVNFLNIQVLNLGNNAVSYQVLSNPTLTGASFNSVGANSQLEFDVAATALSGGDIMIKGYANSSSGSGSSIVTSPILFPYKPVLGKTYAGVSDIITVAARSVTATSSACAAINFREYF